MTMRVLSGAVRAAAVLLLGAGLLGPAAAASGNRLTVTNSCSSTIWMQQLALEGAPVVVKIKSGDSYTYSIPDAGAPSTRFWPKVGCDADGWNCRIGESQGKPKPGGGYTCPPGGCAPPVDSKVEVTWACVGAGCSVKKAKTFYDISQVDGFTLPFSIKARGTVQNAACEPTNCSQLNMSQQCPTAEDLSSNGAFPALSSVDLRMRDPSGKVVGCFSPCMKLTASNYGGLGYGPSSAQAKLYCCPTPPVSSAQCNAGPVPKTKFVQYMHQACYDKAYAFAYDDADGNHACQGYTTISMTLCPPVPADAPQ